MLRQIVGARVCLVFSVFVAISSASTLAQSQPEILPTGMALTPLAQPGTLFQSLNPGWPSLPNFRVDMARRASPYPTTRSGHDFRNNRRHLFAEALRQQAQENQRAAKGSQFHGTKSSKSARLSSHSATKPRLLLDTTDSLPVLGNELLSAAFTLAISFGTE